MPASESDFEYANAPVNMVDKLICSDKQLLQKYVGKEMQYEYIHWRKQKDKEFNIALAEYLENPDTIYRQNHGMFDFVEAEVQRREKRHRVEIENKKEELKRKADKAMEWWVRGSPSKRSRFSISTRSTSNRHIPHNYYKSFCDEWGPEGGV